MGDTATQPTEQQQAFAEVWDLVCKLADQDGVAPIKELPGLWNKVAGKWQFWMNGKSAEIATESGCKVSPFNIYVEFNGWPAGFLDPYGGTIAAGGLANIFTFRDALRAEVRA